MSIKDKKEPVISLEEQQMRRQSAPRPTAEEEAGKLIQGQMGV